MQTHAFDGNYVHQLTAGDPATVDHFTKYFGELMLIVLRSRLRSPQLIEDIRQETFLRVLRALRDKSIEHPERLGGFVRSVCENVTREALRSSSRHPQLDEEADPPDNTIDLDSELVTEERKHLVRSVLDELSPQDRKVLRMLFLEEKNKDEVCRIMHVDRNYLRVLAFRARNRFRAALGKTHAAEMS